MSFIPPVSTITVAGVQFLMKNLIVLTGACNNGVPANASTPQKIGAGVGYTPSGSKIFRIYAYQLISYNAASVFFSFGYADNDVGFASNVGFTNYTPPFSDSGYFPSGLMGPTGSSFAVFEAQMNAIIPNGKYGGVTNNSAGSGMYHLYGYEE